MKLMSIFMLLIFVGTARANDIAEMTESVCEKVKVCGLAQMQQQGLPQAMEEVMKTMFDRTCTTIVAPYVNRTFGAGLEAKAASCLGSINALDCQQLMAGGAEKIPACKEYKTAADEAGVTEKTG